MKDKIYILIAFIGAIVVSVICFTDGNKAGFTGWAVAGFCEILILSRLIADGDDDGR